MNKQNKFQFIIPLITMGLCIAGIVTLQKQQYTALKSQVNVDFGKEEEKLKVVLDVQKKLPTLGFDNLIASWTYLRFIQYYGDGVAREKTGYSLASDYFEILARLDPRFIQGFLRLSTANSLFAGNPAKTVPLMQKVIDKITPDIKPKSRLVMDNAHLLWMYKAWDETLFFGNNQAAQKSYEKTAEWVSLRGDDIGEYAANNARRTAKFLANNTGTTKTRISAWLSILSYAPDKQTQDYAINQIQSLGGQVNITPEGKLQVKLPAERK